PRSRPRARRPPSPPSPPRLPSLRSAAPARPRLLGRMPADTPPVVTLARDLLGRILASDIGGERTSGVIVETEAYLGIDDPAAHAWQGKRRKGHLGVWSPPGSWYVYRSYGIHWC